MYFSARTDLASEARELWEQNPSQTTKLEGVEARDEDVSGFHVASVDILDEKGSSTLCKPIGKYFTLSVEKLIRRSSDAFENACTALSSLLRRFAIPETGDILVACLGNPNITPDAIGPLAADSVLVTRHLKRSLPDDFKAFRSVTVLRTGVLGTTGIDSAENVQAVCERLRPACVIAVDALASADLGRLCSTVQLTDTGISPGSGVGNDRAALNAESLGIPVLAVGVPTVVDAASLTEDAAAKGMFVTPRGIDELVRCTARLVGYGIDLALHPGITVSDIDMLVD